MEFFDAVVKRTSIRKYRQERIEPAVLEKIVDAGRRAPTARAVEPWRFVVVTEKEKLAELSRLAPNGAFVKEAAAAIIVFCADTKYYLEDGCAATENILLAAAACGLGACWIAGDKKDYAGEVAALFGAAQDLKLISIVSLGYAAEEKQQKKNSALEQVMFREKF